VLVTRLVLVRHGESIVTVNRVIGGHRTCTGLSPLGRTQAERLRDRWSASPDFTADVLIASHYARAQETAHILSPALGGLEPFIDAGFGEHDPGPECDGLKYTDFTERYPSAGRWWESTDPFAATFPGGETVAAFHFRVGTAVRRVLDTHAGRTVVVACHGGVIDAALRMALRAPAMGGFDIHTLNTSITDLQHDPGRSVWKLVRYNDHAHLAGLPSNTDPA
jgi:probable phosphoglycerate mutase